MLAIIGAGISGLSLACFLKQLGYPSKDIFILEKTDSCGGVLQTIFDKGYQIEKAASLYPYHQKSASDLCELLDLKDKIIPLQAKTRYLYSPKGLQEFSLSLSQIYSTSLISLKTKWTILKNLFTISKKDGDQNLQDFFGERLGEETFTKIVEPILSGIFAGDPKKLSLHACFPQLITLQKTSLAKYIFSQKRKKPFFVSFQNGMQELVSAMHSYLQDNIHLKQPLKKISTQNGKIYCHLNKKKILCKKIVLCLPSYCNDSLLQDFPIAKGLRQKIQYSPLVLCAFALEKKPKIIPSSAIGFLNPACYNKGLLGGFFVSNMFPHTSKKGFLSQFIFGGIQNPKLIDWSEKEILKKAKEYYQKILQTNQNPCYYKIIKWKKAIPQYNMQHLTMLKKIEKVEKKLPLYFHSSSYRGVGLSACIENSFKLAKNIVDEKK